MTPEEACQIVDGVARFQSESGAIFPANIGQWIEAARTLRQALAEAQESRDMWLRTYKESEITRQHLCDKIEGLEDQLAQQSIDISNATTVANTAEDERDAALRRLDAAMKVIEATRGYMALPSFGSVPEYDAIRIALAALDKEPVPKTASTNEVEWLRRLLHWCRPRLKHASYQTWLDEYLAAGPSPAPEDEPPVVASADSASKTASLLGVRDAGTPGSWG